MSRKIIAVVDDLFFASKIRAAADFAQVQVSFPRHLDSVIDAIAREGASLIICDLHSQRIDPLDLARQLRADERTRTIHLLGFFSHLQTELERQAKDAGFEQVMPRSVFSRQLPELIAAKAVQ